MEGTGTLTVRVITSRAQLPVEGATVVVTQRGTGGKYQLLSVQATDRSGATKPVVISTPALGESTHPGSPVPPTPCATCGRSILATPCAGGGGPDFSRGGDPPVHGAGTPERGAVQSDSEQRPGDHRPDSVRCPHACASDPLRAPHHYGASGPARTSGRKT